MEIGDQVLFNPEDRYEVEVRGNDYIILRERDIHAVAAERLDQDQQDFISRMESSLEQFIEHAKAHTVIPVWKELVADLITPVSAFERIVGDQSGFLLESVEHGERWSRWSFIGRNPLLTIKKVANQLLIEGEIPLEFDDNENS